MRPIDADALLLQETIITDEYGDELNVVHGIDVRCAPTLSPDEVRGVGQPVKIFNDPWTGKMFTTCSRCDGKISPKDCYCKHCGARMKGAEDETTDNA